MEIEEEGIDVTDNLPYDLFLLSTALRPFVCADLLIRNRQGQILLSRRSDDYYGAGWQIPGGILRMRETLADRIQRTAIEEIGADVICNYVPLAVREHMLPIYGDNCKSLSDIERSHNIGFLYECFVREDYEIDNKGKSESDNGFLKWFDSIPDDILECHTRAYGDILKKLSVMKEH